MSVVFYGFLGRDTQDIENRLVQEFARIGFTVLIHPDMKLLESNASERLYLSFLKTPPHIKRTHPDVPLLVGFGYSASPRTSNWVQEEGWPPRNVKRCTYEIFTRTSSGRSAASYFAQALTVAILAKLTNGQFFVDGEDQAVSGSAGLEQVLAELSRSANSALDAEAEQFQAWPPLNPAPVRIRQELVSPRQATSATASVSPQKPAKISAMGIFAVVMVMLFFILIIFYSSP